MTPDQLAGLRHASERLRAYSLRRLLNDPGRFESWSLRVGPLLVDFSRQCMDEAALQTLGGILEEFDWEARRDAMFRGEPINRSERRAVLHTALRARQSALPALAPAAVLGEVDEGLQRIRALVAAVQADSGDYGLPRGITDVINVGIGGSDLGPRLAVQALERFRTGALTCHFLANLDGDGASGLMRTLDPRRTLVLLVSKSFTTQETLLNGQVLHDWVRAAYAGEAAKAAGHFVAVTANAEAARAFGIAPQRTLPMWDFVGGRYSVWSAVGLALALAVGNDAFAAFLRGAARMDDHFRTAPWRHNLPVLMALIGIWNRNALERPGLAVIPYCDALGELPAFLQQLEMESLGKSVRPDGQAVAQPTAPVLWGNVGTNAQHAFFQALHQGTDVVPVDFIGVIDPGHRLHDNHRALLANMLAQAAALAAGKSFDEALAEATHGSDAERRALAAQRTFPGNRPSTTILLDTLSPESLGALIALYEHKVFVQSLVWEINAFDQWGVELGKTLAKAILPALSGGADSGDFDVATHGMVAAIRASNLREHDTPSS